ncbi:MULTISPECIES: hypothetical protein [Nitrospirillum]|uniref:Uncharacterized protein n=1 Tax=Nitrospirillum amazonense TaxID=28077 RepID=A0A560H1A2_9PROT|nr:hypothetical protein [Nitrospirillum amazonense]MEC4589455.1 hypothetical protein [Nitrospirillum amazonense]TWB27739.1 hypothetical protein FBZ88_106203 [Nitrospirillum amazonense]TWB40062.1 hypothetical protein FBZ91_105297 [Nitrospirillum amazonense]TWB82644.1 hypothetical protein FBZ87_101353 [Nitrospirillum amazonense]
MPGKRYLIEFVVALLAYGLLMTLALMALNNGWVQGGTRTVVAFAPMVACVGIWWAVVRHLRRSGPEEGRVQLIAIGFAFAGTALLTFTYGFLEVAGFPRLSMFTVWPLMVLLLVVGQFLGRWLQAPEGDENDEE